MAEVLLWLLLLQTGFNACLWCCLDLVQVCCWSWEQSSGLGPVKDSTAVAVWGPAVLLCVPCACIPRTLLLHRTDAGVTKCFCAPSNVVLVCIGDRVWKVCRAPAPVCVWEQHFVLFQCLVTRNLGLLLGLRWMVAQLRSPWMLVVALRLRSSWMSTGK